MSIALTGPALVAYNGYDVGLGNRVRVVLGCRSLAELEGRRLYYVWPTGKLFGPEFSDLWDFTGGRKISRAASRLLARRYPYVDHTLTWLDDAKRAERVWQVRTGSEIGLPPGARSWREEFRALTPVAEIADRVHAIFDAHLADGPYVGVMVRAHSVSHSVTREASPVDWYLDRLRGIRHDHPELRFFVSCDVPEVQERIVREIPGCFGQTGKGAYNSTQAVRASVVDLYLLASAGHLIGPHFSSFVHLAEHLTGDFLRLETSVTGTPDTDLGALTRVKDPLKPAERV